MNTMQEEFNIDLMALAKALWKNILVIALAAVLVGSLAFARTAQLPPQYQATASMFINSKNVTLGSMNVAISASDLNTSNSVINAYLYIMKSRTTMEDIIQEAGLSYTPEQLSGKISARSVNNTAALEVTVTSNNPAEAELIANTLAKILPVRISDIVEGTSVRIVDYAIIPSHRSGPDVTGSTMKGILVGAALGAALVVLQFFLKERSNDTIKSADDLRMMYPDMVVLAMIPNMQVSEKKNSYYYSYYGDPKAKKKGGRDNGRSQRA